MGASTVVVGFGVVGAAAVRQLLRDKIAPSDVVVVDVRQDAVDEANRSGCVRCSATAWSVRCWRG